MKTHILVTVSLLFSSASITLANSEAMDTLLQTYAAQGAATTNAEQGKRLWVKTYQNKGEFSERSCTSCHTQDLTAPGKHAKTGKIIKSMSPSSNPERLTDIKKIEKWFKRNCKWTMGRECTVQEKANFLAYIDKPTNF
ncbi:MAG: DUF1924 domain-containing protein [Gammaproteobacteria bacterium]|nr:DUF1924 domain-containing protein [Gammaproteobacteria bacterium]